jgi:hypothetical protein
MEGVCFTESINLFAGCSSLVGPLIFAESEKQHKFDWTHLNPRFCSLHSCSDFADAAEK